MDAPSPPFSAYQPGSPWPVFRRDHRNTGRSPLPAHFHGDQPWCFQTGKGIFATPVIDSDGVIYVGSADHHFYAIGPDGRLRWSFRTGEIIDSAAALPRTDPAIGPTIIAPSGDGFLYCLRTAPQASADRILWKFDARTSPRSSYNNWWEGNVAIGPDGALYAGNTNFNYYALTPDGALRWVYETGANNWSQAAFAADGAIFWGSNDTKIRAVSSQGVQKWARRTWGFIAASAALGSDGSLYIGSFDSNLYALDSRTGKVRWKFKTGDHIYASAALGEDKAGQTTAIYFGSTDGVFYALSPHGRLLWSFDTGMPIRSSAVVGAAPAGQPGEIVYFGCGDGRLYALDAADGARRWSFDTTPADLSLAGRNDLNGSPALGVTGVYIGGEHGQLWYVPYDYPLHVPDPRGSIRTASDLPADAAGLYYVSPAGNLCLTEPPALPAASVLTLRLLVREGGQTIPARLGSPPFRKAQRRVQITATPPFPFTWEPSADGRYLHIFPGGRDGAHFLTPGQSYRLRIRGEYDSGGLRLGNLTLGGRKRGEFDTTVTLGVAPDQAEAPWQIGRGEVTALGWTRLAVPIPTMLPSLNQIGFDYMHWILGAVALSPDADHSQGKLVLWAIGGKLNPEGLLIPDPTSDFTLPLSGAYQRGSFILSNRSFQLAVTGIPIPFNLFQLRGQMGADLQVGPGATLFADTRVLSIPTFGPLLVLAGLASNGWEKLLAVGTYVTRRYDRAGGANIRPQGVSIAGFAYRPPSRRAGGSLSVRFALAPGCAYPLSQHRPGLVLIDASRTEAIPLDYHSLLSSTADAAGNLAAVTLRIPAAARLPRALQAIVLLDVFPLHTLHL